jgi:uncharacterized protein (DUF305 family)
MRPPLSAALRPQPPFMRFSLPSMSPRELSMIRSASALAVLALVATTAFHASAQAPVCTPEHAKMGHCKMDGAPPANPAAPAAVDHSKMGHGASPAAAGDTASTKAFKAANDKMHAGMNIPFSGNADVDFVKGMLPHHQGAVDMAKIVLQHGKDPALKKLARDIIKAQDKEIAFMNRWLAKNAKN